jgi:hypothetical protein
MEPDFIEFIRNARKRKAGKFRNQLTVFLVCFGMSVFLWLLVHLSKEYYYSTDYRLNFTQVPWNMKMKECSDSMLTLTLQIQGYEFFSEQFFRKKKRETDVSLRGIKVKYNEDEASGYILTRSIGKDIAEQNAYPMDIYATSPDTIYFTFERKSPHKNLQ